MQRLMQSSIVDYSAISPEQYIKRLTEKRYMCFVQTYLCNQMIFRFSERNNVQVPRLRRR